VTALVPCSTDISAGASNRYYFADQSGHTVQLDQPEAAVAAIVKMAAQVRQP
jgi:pimeloyl-ACP methyl ester carboxylesterase